MEKKSYNKLVKAYLNSLLAGNRNEAEQICDQFLADGGTIKELYEHIIKPALYDVGILWERNRISVADEHLATAITEGILNVLYTSIIPGQQNGKKVVLSCVEGESHQVGIKMVADVFEMHGWDTFLVGSGIPLNELLRYITNMKPQLLAVSLSIYFNFSKLIKMVASVQDQFPELPILVGGQAFLHAASVSLPGNENTHYIRDLNELDSYLENMHTI